MGVTMSGSVLDVLGEGWVVRLCSSNLIRVKEQAGIDLLKILEDKSVLGRLLGEMFTQQDVLYAICDAQVKAKEIGIDQWRDRWDGPTLEVAIHEVLESLAKFFPKSQGAALREGVKTTQAFVDRIFQKSEQIARDLPIDQLVSQAGQKMEAALSQSLGSPVQDSPKGDGTSFGTVPESLESTPEVSTEPAAI